MIENIAEQERYRIFEMLSQKTKNEIEIFFKSGVLSAGDVMNPETLKYLRVFDTREAVRDEFVILLCERIRQKQAAEVSTEMLIRFASQGNALAQQAIVHVLKNDAEALYRDDRDDTIRFGELRKWTSLSRIAEDEAVTALIRGHFDQFKRPPQERQEEVRTYAKKGNILAQGSMVEEYDEQNSLNRWDLINYLLLFLAPDIPTPNKIL